MPAELQGDMPGDDTPKHTLLEGSTGWWPSGGTISKAVSGGRQSQARAHARCSGEQTDVWACAGTVRNATPGTSLGVSAMCAERTWRISVNVRRCCLVSFMLCLSSKGALMRGHDILSYPTEYERLARMLCCASASVLPAGVSCCTYHVVSAQSPCTLCCRCGGALRSA